MATRASEPPTLMRRTPIAAISSTVKPKRAAIEEIHRLRRHGLHHGLDLLAGLDAGRIEAIGAGRRIGFQAADRIVEIVDAADEIFRPRGEHDIAAGAVDRGARRFHARDRGVEIVERLLAVIRRILDREAGDAGGDATRDVLGEAFEVIGKAVLEIGIERHVGRFRDLAKMRQHLIAALRAVGIALRMGVARARRRQGFEAQALQIARAADIPRIGNDEAAGFVKLTESLPLVGGRWTGPGHDRSQHIDLQCSMHLFGKDLRHESIQ